MNYASQIQSCKDHTCIWECVTHTVNINLNCEGILQEYSNFLVLLADHSPGIHAFSS